MLKEEVKIGDTLVSNKGVFAKVVCEGSNSFGVIIDEKNAAILSFKQLKHWRKFKNPIKDNRIVDSYTFAVRFSQFLEWIPKEWIYSQPHYLEEFGYMQYVAKSLLTFQVETVTNENEIKYLTQLKLLCDDKE